jgi:hypothetical protein
MVGTEGKALNNQTCITRIKTVEPELSSVEKLEYDLHGMDGLAVGNHSSN